MRRIVLLTAPFLLVAVLIAGRSPGGSAQTVADLPLIALTPADLGPSWQLLSQSLNPEAGFYTAVFQREGSSVAAPAQLDLLLFLNPDGSIPTGRVFETAMETLATSYLPFVLTADRVPPARVGADTIQARTALTLGQNQFLGDLLAWRRGPIIALMLYTIPEDVNVVPLAELQDAKIAAALAILAPSPSPSPSVAPTSLAFVSITGVAPGGMASVTVQAAPGARCSIAFVASTGVRLQSPGLESKDADATGLVTWTWLVDERTPRGAGSVSVTCDGATITAPIQIL